jgi:hypothetical protein
LSVVCRVACQLFVAVIVALFVTVFVGLSLWRFHGNQIQYFTELRRYQEMAAINGYISMGITV